MASNRYPIKTPSSAELSATRLLRRIMRRARAAIVAAVERTWPNTTEADIRAAVASTLDPRTTMQVLSRIALLVQRANHQQLARLLPTLKPWNRELELQLSGEWVIETYQAIEAWLLQGHADDARLDGTPSLINSVMGRLRALRATNAEIVQVLDELKRVAPQEELAVISRVRARVVRWAAKANERRQREAGVKRYTWRTKRDGRVRQRHAELDDTIQLWSRPPVISKDGRRGHPGEDYNCRCVAIPIPNKRSKAVEVEEAL